MVRLVDPPREIPLALQLKLLAHRDVTGSLFFLLPAAAALVGGAFIPETALRVVCFVVGSVLLDKGQKLALPALYRSVATLRRMRFGFVTLGRIVSCHLAWDSKRAEMPYREFLEDWVVNMGRSQMGKLFGCLATILVVVFVVPMVLITLIAAIAFVAGALGLPGGAAMAGDLDGPYLAKWSGAMLLFIALLMLFLRFNRRQLMDQVAPYMEWRRLAHPGTHDVYDEQAMRLVAQAKERGAQISLKVPLPEDHSGIELVCKVEYSVMGERCAATARARLSNRLDLAGVEQLIFIPAEREKIDLFVGLPDEAGIDAQGRWSSVPAVGTAVLLTLTGAVTVLALAAFWWHLLAISAMLR
jgi:hypothetical protein